MSIHFEILHKEKMKYDFPLFTIKYFIMKFHMKMLKYDIQILLQNIINICLKQPVSVNQEKFASPCIRFKQ